MLNQTRRYLVFTTYFLLWEGRMFIAILYSAMPVGGIGENHSHQPAQGRRRRVLY